MNVLWWQFSSNSIVILNLSKVLCWISFIKLTRPRIKHLKFSTLLCKPQIIYKTACVRIGYSNLYNSALQRQINISGKNLFFELFFFINWLFKALSNLSKCQKDISSLVLQVFFTCQIDISEFFLMLTIECFSHFPQKHKICKYVVFSFGVRTVELSFPNGKLRQKLDWELIAR